MVFKHLELYLSKLKSSSRKQSPTVIEELCHRFSLTDIRKSTNNFDESQLVERAGFSNVYRGCLEPNIAGTDGLVFVKRMKNYEGMFEMFTNEIELLCQLNHPNLVSLIGFCDHKDEKIIVYKYTSSRSLEKCLYGGVIDQPLSWKKRLEICIGIARGLHYLHSGIKRTIIHRGVKPRNILLDSNMVPKLTNFSLVLRGPRFMSKPKPIQGITIGGTVGYMAHECVTYGIFSDKSDVYAFGGILLQVVCARRITEIMDDIPIEDKTDPILNGKIEPQCWEIYMSTAKRCLNVDPNERPTMGEVEVELEQTLRLQEQADITDNNAYYTLLSDTIIDSWDVSIGTRTETDTESMDTEDN